MPKDYKTSDMALVTYLRMLGHAPQAFGWVSGTCTWTFTPAGNMMGEVDKFLAGEALVEPKEYNRLFASSKREMYDSRPVASNQ